MDAPSLLIELYERIAPLVERTVDELNIDELTHQIIPDTNTIGWLVWHLARVQDHHVSEVLGTDQTWVGGDWAARFGVDPDPGNTGYGHSASEMLAIRPDGPQVLIDYLAAVQQRTIALLCDLDHDGLDRVVDDRWDPPVTLGVRLVSVADDSLQHVGQAGFVRGALGR